MKPIKIAIIGLGGRGVSQGQIVKQHGGHLYEIVGLCDPFPNKLDAAAKTFGLSGKALFSSHEDLLERSEAEAVIVETDAQSLAPISCRAMNSGKHVLCDVPMAFTREDCWDLVRTAEKTGLTYCMAEQVRFAGFIQAWKRSLAAGEIGEPLFIQGEYIHPVAGWYFEDRATGKTDWDHGDPNRQKDDAKFKKSWRNSFKHVIKYISHELSPLLSVIDDRVVQVSCYTSNPKMYGDAVEMWDLECALMRTAKGRTVRIVNSFTAPRGGHYFHHWYHVLGTDGIMETARAGWEQQGEMLKRKDGSVTRTNHGWERTDMPFGDAKLGHGGLETFVFQEFYEAIRNKKPPYGDVYRAVEAVLPGIVAAESAEAKGVMLEVPDVRPGKSRPKAT